MDARQPMTDESMLSAWTLLGSPGELRAASYLIGSNAKQYRLIVDTLADQQEVSLTGVGHDELESLVRARFPDAAAKELSDELRLAERLKQLVEWGTCETWQDKAETEAEFLRNRARYQLTEAGARINKAAHEIEDDLGPASTAALLAPHSLVERLTGTLNALASARVDDASLEFAQVENTLDAMAKHASDWQSRLAGALGGGLNEAQVARLLETILAYVEAWGAGVDEYSAPIVAMLPALRAIPDDTWRAMTLARLGSAARPDDIERARTHMAGIVSTLERWFGGDSPQATRLRRQMRNSVAPVLRGHRTLLAVGGTVSRAAELVRLADAIATAPDDEAAWRLWATGTGLYSARHLTQVTPEISGIASVWEAPPVPISKRLRAQGKRSLPGKASRIADTTQARQAARAEAAKQQKRVAQAEAKLVSRTGSRFSEWTPLSAGEADLLLRLVSAARDGRGTGVSPDGRWTMTLTPTVPARSAVLHTDAGRLVLNDALVEFRR